MLNFKKVKSFFLYLSNTNQKKEAMEFKQGDRVDHERYGEGIISRVSVSSYEAIFERGGKVSLAKFSHGLTLIESNQQSTESNNSINFDDIYDTIESILIKHNAVEYKAELGNKWIGGTMLLQPANLSLKPKEIPIEVFFHKIVMLRDRLRVLEQNVNAHAVLNDEEKVNLQQYITRCYGSLTTFNILFDDKEYNFVGSSGKD